MRRLPEPAFPFRRALKCCEATHFESFSGCAEPAVPTAAATEAVAPDVDVLEAAKARFRPENLTKDSSKRFVCHSCSFRTKFWSLMDKHSRVHTGEKPFECSHPGCGFRAAQKFSVKRHERIHTQPPRVEAPPIAPVPEDGAGNLRFSKRLATAAEKQADEDAELDVAPLGFAVTGLAQAAAQNAVRAVPAVMRGKRLRTDGSMHGSDVAPYRGKGARLELPAAAAPLSRNLQAAPFTPEYPRVGGPYSRPSGGAQLAIPGLYPCHQGGMVLPPAPGGFGGQPWGLRWLGPPSTQFTGFGADAAPPRSVPMIPSQCYDARGLQYVTADAFVPGVPRYRSGEALRCPCGGVCVAARGYFGGSPQPFRVCTCASCFRRR